MRKLGIALAGAAALSFASAAQATTSPINLDSSSGFDFAALNGTNDGINFADNTSAGIFTDTLLFTNDIAGLFKLQVQTIGGDNFFENLACSGCGITISGPGGSRSFNSGTATSVGYIYELNNFQFGVGQYTLTLTGDSPNGGMLNGLVSFTAVPEPAAWAMMLIGFAAVGASMRRRRNRLAIPQLA